MTDFRPINPESLVDSLDEDRERQISFFSRKRRRYHWLFLLFFLFLMPLVQVGCDADTQKTAQTAIKGAKKSKGYVKRVKSVWNKYAGKYGIYLAVGLIVLAIALLILFIWWSRRRKALTDLSPIPEFGKIWQTFLSAVPKEFAYCIELYQHYIAIGESGSGKSLAIDLYSDWQGQARQFYPSYSTDPDLQCFLGSQVVVQELPAPQLQNTDPRLRQALLKHWRKLYKKRDPIVVVTVKGPSLIGMTPETLKRQAQLIRGKINILSQIRGKAVETRVVLTHMDELNGFSEFTRYLRQHRTPLAIKLKDINDFVGVGETLLPYEQYLTRILTHLPGQDYMKVLTYFEEVPELLERAGEFAQVLTQPDPLSYAPAVEEIFLGAAAQQSSSPYHLKPESAEFTASQRPRFKHRVACCALLAFAFIYFSYTFLGERFYWQTGVESVATFYTAPQDGRDLEILDDSEVVESLEDLELLDYLNQQENPFAWGPLYHHSEWQKRVVTRFLEGLRQSYLLPKLRKIIDNETGGERSLYLLAVLYSSRESELGQRILLEIDRWSRLLKIDPMIVRGYIENSETAWSERNLPEIAVVLDRVESLNSDEGFTRWLVFLEQLQPFMETSKPTSKEVVLLQGQLSEIQAAAERLQENFERTQRWILALKLCQSKPLKRLPAVKASYERLTSESKYTKWIRKATPDIEVLLPTIINARIDDTPKSKDMHLAQFMRSVQAIRALPKPSAKRLEFEVGVEAFKLDIANWNQLILRSKLKGFLSQFMGEIQKNGMRLFFNSRNVYPDIVLNRTNNGSFVYRGKARIPGRFTRGAYDKQVLEVFKKYDSFYLSFEKLLDKNSAQRFQSLIDQQIYAYAQQYHDANLAFYVAFQVRTPSTGALRVAVRQMQLPVSPFSDFIQTIAVNTELADLPPVLNPKTTEKKEGTEAEEGDEEKTEDSAKAEGPTDPNNPEKAVEKRQTRLEPILAKMRRFEPIWGLAKTLSEGLSELDKYKQILGLIQARLEGGEVDDSLVAATIGGNGATPVAPAKPEKKDPAEISFEAQLTPAGAMSLVILQDGRDSYLSLTSRWLNSVGLRKEMQRPFFTPIFELYKIGLEDIEINVAKNWQTKVYTEAKPFLLRFPFNPKQKVDVNPLKLTETFKQDGRFWTLFNSLVLPVLKGKNGQLIARNSIIRQVKLPGNLLSVANRIDRLTKALWDEAGEPKALKFHITPGLLADASRPNRPAMVLSFLSAGGSSVFGFNQKPYKQVLSVRWWDRETSATGLRLIDREEEREFYLRNRVTNQLWSIWRLLLKGEELKKGEFTWNVAEEAGGLKLTRFRYEEHPWELFRIENPTKNLK
jgi:hypothetical protein